MIRIYHVTGTRGTRAIWLCEELEIPYEVEKVDFSPDYRSTPEWRALNPVGKVPVMTDGDMTMFESGAMVQYILARYGKGRLEIAADDPAHGPYLQWMWFAEATLSRPLGEIVNHGREFPGEDRIAAVVEEMADRSVASLQAVADHMQDKQFLVNETFTAADICMGYSIMLGYALVKDRVPEGLLPYWQLLDARPAFQKARAY